MAWLPTEINTEEMPEYIPPEGGPLPQDNYIMMVTKVEQKPCKGDGVMLNVEFDVKFPERFASRKFWDSFVIVHNEQKTANIGRERLGNLAKGCGLKTISDDEQLIGKEVMGELYIKPAEPYTDKHGAQQSGKPQNKCREYWPVGADIENLKKARSGNKKTEKTGTVTSQPAQGAPPAQKWPSAASAAQAPVASQGAAAGTARGPWKSN